MWGSVSLRSSLATVFDATPAFSASSPWVSAYSIRRALSLSPMVSTYHDYREWSSATSPDARKLSERSDNRERGEA
jgi:hypothetical protein